MQFLTQDQDREPTGYDQQVASVQATTTATEMWYDASHLNDTTPVVRLGSTWDDNFGNIFMYVKAQANLTVGQFVSFQAPTTGTCTSAGSTVYVLNTNFGLTQSEKGNYLYSQDAAGQTSSSYRQALRRIKNNTSTGTNDTITLSVQGSVYGNNIYDLDALARVPANGGALSIIRPFNVISATASTTPIGVALGTITASSSTAPIYTIIQIAGLAMVQANNTVGPTIVGLPGAMQAAGVFSGPTSGAQTVGNIQTVLGTSILPLFANSSGTTSLLPAYINFLGT